MALSGSFSTSVTTAGGQLDDRYPRNLVVTWSATQNIANNTSTINWTLKTGNSSSEYYYTSVNRVKLVINGTTVYNDQSTGTMRYRNTTLGSGSITVSHNSDGTKSIPVYAEAGFYEWTPNSSYSGTITLNTIPRASSFSLSASSVNVGSNITANISRASSNFTHHVKIWVSGHEDEANYTAKVTGVGTSATFSIPTTWYNAMPSSTSCTAYCRVATYNGSTWIGNSDTKAFTVTVPSSIVPTIGTITLTPATINGKNILVQGKNKLTVSVSGCSAGTGSSVKSYTFSGPSIATTTTSTSVSANSISSTGTLTYTVKVTDNRGRTASKSATITCYAYSTPYFSSFSAYRSNSSGTADNNGSYVKCSYGLAYAPVNNTNDVTVKILYKKNSATSYSSVTSLTDSTATSGNQILNSIALDSTYTIYATITDNYSGSSSSQTITIFGASRVLNILKSGEGVAFGKMAETEKLLDVKWPIKSGDPINTLQNFSYRGNNLISSTANDTTANWNNQGNLATTFYTATGKINGQPSQYGFLLNLTTGPGGQEAHQLWLAQNNGNISHRGGNSSGMATSWKTCLDSSNYTSYVSAKPTTLYSTSTGNNGTITLSSSAANFTYLEIFYTDNNTRQPTSIKVYSPNGKYVSLSCIEPSTSGSEPRVYIRTSGWTISDTTMTPGRSDLSGANRGVYGQFYKDAGGTNVDVNVTANNYIKIFRVLGYA